MCVLQAYQALVEKHTTAVQELRRLQEERGKGWLLPSFPPPACMPAACPMPRPPGHPAARRMPLRSTAAASHCAAGDSIASGAEELLRCREMLSDLIGRYDAACSEASTLK
jgi:hypothetical protein